ncbi:Outer membrane protein beta-barrel domain-containing protein [Saccharicrinis carchari]|uniref:Outer membrane protein beta-barrel domain-containing protein n=1 Tax=Saccharicrinis carchari TaxID=1168039 RepID=A0A521DN60_SACCC|nr:outer membrane beta-barrel protein [Saccharicrinis carchari]SMO73042.1 Outer membrane protein beta-barrel domain-containing protein [Saccharicrinis carchari]
MKKNNNIDRIFSEGLANYSETPPAFVWEAIGEGMQGAKGTKKALIIWRSLAAAAVIGLVFLGGLFWHNINKSNAIADADLQQVGSLEHLSEDENKGAYKYKGAGNSKADMANDAMRNGQTQTGLNESKPYEIVDKSRFDNVVQANPASALASVTSAKILTAEENIVAGEGGNASDSQQYAAVDNNSVYTNRRGTGYEIENSNTPVLQKIDEHADFRLADYKGVDANRIFKDKNKAALKAGTINSLMQAFDKQISSPETEKRALQFALGGQFSPSYSYRETGSSGASGRSAVNEDGIVSYTGGINLNVKTRKRWEIETGVYYSQVGQKFSNPLIGHPDKMFLSAGSDAGVQSKKPNLQNSLGNIALDPSSQKELVKEVAITNGAFRLNSDNLGYSPNQVDAITVQQELDYIEVPLLLRYNLIDNLVGLSVSGGMSANFLIDNNAYRVENSSKDRIGETQGINEISYSAIFGMGLRTPIFKSLDFNLEPRLRYFMNSVSDSPGSSYKPYSIGIYTGVSYRF